MSIGGLIGYITALSYLAALNGSLYAAIALFIVIATSKLAMLRILVKISRPYVSNMDAIVIVLAPIPKPDMLLVDKLIIGATENNIQPII